MMRIKGGRQGIGEAERPVFGFIRASMQTIKRTGSTFMEAEYVLGTV
jgi:hypothetical protein